jgi:hypothetical protein
MSAGQYRPMRERRVSVIKITADINISVTWLEEIFKYLFEKCMPTHTEYVV